MSVIQCPLYPQHILDVLNHLVSKWKLIPLLA
jgi:hypothetical protein